MIGKHPNVAFNPPASIWMKVTNEIPLHGFPDPREFIPEEKRHTQRVALRRATPATQLRKKSLFPFQEQCGNVKSLSCSEVT